MIAQHNYKGSPCFHGGDVHDDVGDVIVSAMITMVATFFMENRLNTRNV